MTSYTNCKSTLSNTNKSSRPMAMSTETKEESLDNIGIENLSIKKCPRTPGVSSDKKNNEEKSTKPDPAVTGTFLSYLDMAPSFVRCKLPFPAKDIVSMSSVNDEIWFITKQGNIKICRQNGLRFLEKREIEVFKEVTTSWGAKIPVTYIPLKATYVFGFGVCVHCNGFKDTGIRVSDEPDSGVMFINNEGKITGKLNLPSCYDMTANGQYFFCLGHAEVIQYRCPRKELNITRSYKVPAKTQMSTNGQMVVLSEESSLDRKNELVILDLKTGKHYTKIFDGQITSNPTALAVDEKGNTLIMYQYKEIFQKSMFALAVVKPDLTFHNINATHFDDFHAFADFKGQYFIAYNTGYNSYLDKLQLNALE